MLVVTHNEVQHAIELIMDEAGLEKLIAKLQAMKKFGHVHLYAGDDATPGDLDPVSPHGQKVFHELILTWDGD